MAFVPNTLCVKLRKSKEHGLGIVVNERTAKPQMIISDVLINGPAKETGLVNIGDCILRINDIDVSEMKYECASEILKSVPIDSTVFLFLKGPEGYMTHLETVFLDNGLPRTIRVTKPLAVESMLSKFKRSFSPSMSSSMNSLRRLYHGDSKRNSPSPKKEQYVSIEKLSTKSKSRTCDDIMDVIQNGVPPFVYDDRNDVSTQTQKNVANGSVGTGKNGGKETILEDGSNGSPKITLTTIPCGGGGGGGKEGGGGENVKGDGQLSDRNSETRRSIEILQEQDHIQVIVKGDVTVHSGSYAPTANDKLERGKANGVEGEGHGQTVNVSTKGTQSETPAEKSEKVPDVINGTNKSRSRSGSRHSLFSENVCRSSPERRGSSPAKYYKLKSYHNDKVTTDMLHLKNSEPVACSPNGCKGSVIYSRLKKPRAESRPKEEVLIQAKAFMDEYYTSIKRLNTPSYHKRWQEVMQSIEKTGLYELNKSELTFGAKTAWRNAPRCIGRIQWSKLQVFDARHIKTARGMFEAICNHIKYGTNKGNIRSAITIFPQRTDGKHDFRIWNAQIIRYAGYKNPDGSITGDPVSLEFTEICQKLGWKGKGGMFDILPLVLQADGQDPEWFEIPKDLVMEVPIKHPNYPWFEELGLKWFAFPGVSSLLFDCGGLEFTAAPFNGWYMGTEIGARNLCDEYRYNLAKTFGKRMGLDTNRDSSLWKDRVVVEVNVAILYSFQSMHVTISDHHTAAESFMKHFENEQRIRGGCPADWVWIVPPISGSLTPVYHQEMLNYFLKPSYEYQVEPWKTHTWKKDREKSKQLGDRPKRKFGFRDIARAVKFSAKLMGKALARRVKCTILYGTETGKSERYARTLCEIFKHAFDAKVMCMEDYDIIDLEHEALVLMVTSTFGNGDPPENGWAFADALYEMRHPNGVSEPEIQKTSYIRMSVSSETDITIKEDIKEEQTLQMESGPLGNVRYSVFGLGSRAYPNFCAFGHFLDKVCSELGAERISPMVEGDELCAQEESFKEWANAVFKAACDTFCLQDDVNIQEATGALHGNDQSWSLGKFRLTPQDGVKEMEISAALSGLHGKNIMNATVIERHNLQSPTSERQTILLKLDTRGSSGFTYAPGDHVGIYPANRPDQVETVLSRLHNAPPADQVVKLEVLQERSPPLGPAKSWTGFERFPICTLRTAFTRYLDISITPSKNLLQLFAVLATSDSDRERLDTLAKDSQAYENYKQYHSPNLAEMLNDFPSLKIPPTLLLTQLPLLQQRFYSVSSSPKFHPGEVHLTIAIAKYIKPNGIIHHGICSTWLQTCPVGEQVPCVMRAAPNFHMPEDGTRPIIMVGPGSGIAPFRSFWQQRKIDKEMLAVPRRKFHDPYGEKKGWGSMTIYFGCRDRNIDNIYESELKQYQEEDVLQDVYFGFSREPGKKKTYVQHLLKKNSKAVCDAIVREGGHFYVCGDVQMASDVSDTVEMILKEDAPMSSEEAKNYVLKLRDANRFHEDIFGVTVKRSTPSSVDTADKVHLRSKGRFWKENKILECDEELLKK